jgi:hypothetical protein
MPSLKPSPVWARKTSPVIQRWLNGGDWDFDKKMSRYKTWFNRTFKEKTTSDRPSRPEHWADSNGHGQSYGRAFITNSK